MRRWTSLSFLLYLITVLIACGGVLKVASDLLGTGGPEGIWSLIPLAFIPLLLLLLVGVYRKDVVALGLAIFIAPLLWLSDLSVILTSITGSERFGEHPDAIGKLVGWGSGLLVMLVYIREFVRGIRELKSK